MEIRKQPIRFQKITAPFLLHRLKTNPAGISNLPKKMITPHYCSVLIFKLLTALKQVCNHPHVYNASYQSEPLMSRKPFALIQHLEEILETGEKTLIFSQYTQALFLLQKLLREQLGDEPLVLHGQAAAECAEECHCNVSDAPSRHIFLISLKAGDTGLNLTAASRVIHFDLWYNPAIEDQAIGCAFRIGQCRTVFVSRFICAGALKKMLDEMIQRQR